MKCRRIKESDLEVCSEVFTRVFSSEPWKESWTLDVALNRLSHFFNSNGFLGVLAENTQGEIIAFALGNKEPFCYGELYYLREMCVDTQHQHSGVGSNLSSFLDDCLLSENIQGIYLATGAEIPAAKFYQKNDFKISEDMSFYFKRLNESKSTHMT